MSIRRPTLHESWYRVAGLRLRLRAQVQVSRQTFRGETFHVLRDAASQHYFRLDEPGWQFVGLLDGRRTVDEAWRAVSDRHGDAAPTQGEAVALLGQLHTSNLLDGELPGDALGMFERRRKRRGREVRQQAMNLLFVRIPLWDPDRFLDAARPLFGWTFGRLGVALWLGLMVWAGLSVAGRADELAASAGSVLAPHNLFLLYVATVVTKAAHELAHGVACKAFGRREGAGGEVHTVGVMLLVLMPLPYIDATSSWSFRSKWRRIAVAAAGMYWELAIAAAAAVVWANSAGGTVTHALAFNVIFIAGVTTILFNANPLLRFDGYFILSDLIETPNLMQRANDRLKYLGKRWLFGVRRASDPARSLAGAAGLTAYGIAAFVYRIVLFASIILFVTDQLFFVGALLAAVAIFGWAVVPLGRFVHYLASSPELARTRPRAVAASALPAAALLLLGLVPVPEHARVAGVVEPDPYAEIRAPGDGWVRAQLPNGAAAAPGGPPVALLEDRELSAQRERLAQDLAVLEIRARAAEEGEAATAEAIRRQRDAVAEALEDAEARLAALRVRAPVAGVWSAPPAATGRFVRRGELLGRVVGGGSPVIRLVSDQFVGPRLDALDPGAPIEVRPVGRPDRQVAATVSRVPGGGRRELPSPVLGHPLGGPLALAPSDETGRLAAEPFFELWAAPEPGGAEALLPGERVVARIDLGDAPLLVQGFRMARQVFQERFSI